MYSEVIPKRLAFLLIIAAIALFFSACGILPEEEETLAPPLIQPKRQEYQLAKAERKDITRYVKGIGLLEAATQAHLFFKESGRRIASIDIKYGDSVKKGDAVAHLENGGLESKIKQQEIKVEKIGLELDRLKKQLSLYMAMQPEFRPAALELDKQQDDIKLKEMDLKSEQIGLEDLKKALNDSVLRAPFDGEITFIENLKEGDSIDAYKTLVTVSDFSKFNVYYQSNSVRDVKTGMKAKVVYENEEYEGVVTLSPESVPIDALEKFKNAIIISVPDLPKASEGSSVDISIAVESKKNALVVPKKCINRVFSNNIVRVLEGDSLKEFSVETGVESYEEIEVLSGLKEGQTLIVN